MMTTKNEIIERVIREYAESSVEKFFEEGTMESMLDLMDEIESDNGIHRNCYTDIEEVFSGYSAWDILNEIDKSNYSSYDEYFKFDGAELWSFNERDASNEIQETINNQLIEDICSGDGCYLSEYGESLQLAVDVADRLRNGCLLAYMELTWWEEIRHTHFIFITNIIKEYDSDGKPTYYAWYYDISPTDLNEPMKKYAEIHEFFGDAYIEREYNSGEVKYELRLDEFKYIGENLWIDAVVTD